MGRVIVYCQICGQSLKEDDFERGKASRIENSFYCATCRAPEKKAEPRPAPPPPPPSTARRTSTDRVPVFRSDRPPSTTRMPRTAPRQSAALLWLSLLFIAVVAGVGLTIALAGMNTSTPPDPPAIVDPPSLPRSKAAPPVDAADPDLVQLRRLLAAPPAAWEREVIDVLLARRPDVEGLKKDYARGLLGLGLREGLVGHWTLDETEGSVARDSSGRGNDGKVLGAPARVAGRIGGAFRFRGNGEDGVEIPSANELDILESKSYSLCAWFQPDSLPPGSIDTANDAWYAVLVRAGGHVGLSMDRAGRVEMSNWLGTQKSAFHWSSDRLPPGVWTHIVGIVDAGAGRTRIFINGRSSGETEWPLRSTVQKLTSPWRVGIALPKSKEWGWWTRGVIDDVRFYARALAADEIALLAEGAALPLGAPPARTPSNDGLLLHLRANAGVTAEGGTVNGWEDVDRKLAAQARGDARPTVKDAGIAFDGKNDRVVLAALPELAFKDTDSFTLIAKVHLESAPRGRWMGVFAKSADQAPWYGIYIDTAGRWVFGSAVNLHGSFAKPGVSTVAAVQIGGRERRLYVDGVRVATGPPMDGSGPGEIWIGGVKSRGEHFAGAVQELRLWRRALDPLELTK